MLGTGASYFHQPPFRLLQATDLQLPHVWDIVDALSEPVQRNQDQSLFQYLVGAAVYTWAEAFIGFAVGAFIGVVARRRSSSTSQLAERAFVPYVIASQTIPIVALAPLIVVGFGRGLTSVVIIATYLTFFPVTIAMLRGLRSSDPRALELMRSYAASQLGDLLEGPPAGVDALPVHGAQDRGRRERRGRHHRRGSGRREGRPGPGHRQLQPAVHHRPGEAVGRRSSSRRSRASASTSLVRVAEVIASATARPAEA